eukprot:gene13252-15660_t
MTEQSLVAENTAASGGGAYVSGDFLLDGGSVFDGNSATGYGSGSCVDSLQGGGGLYVQSKDDGTPTVVVLRGGSMLARNRAHSGGGSEYDCGGYSLLVTSVLTGKRRCATAGARGRVLRLRLVEAETKQDTCYFMVDENDDYILLEPQFEPGSSSVLQTALTHPRVIQVLGPYFAPFKPDLYIWAGYDMLRKVVQTSGAILIQLVREEYDLYYTSIVTIIALAIHAHFRPYTDGIVNSLQTVILANEACVVTVCIAERYRNDDGVMRLVVGCSMLAVQVALGMLIMFYILKGLDLQRVMDKAYSIDLEGVVGDGSAELLDAMMEHCPEFAEYDTTSTSNGGLRPSLYLYLWITMSYGLSTSISAVVVCLSPFRFLSWIHVALLCDGAAALSKEGP